MSDVPVTSYEEIPYESKPLYPTHPDCLGALAKLMGMRPAPVDRCRVLELGCASGGNLIPMAEALPESRFVGIDLSPGQISTGEATIRALGLENISLSALSILNVDDSFGQFDYIACHGVYSWVPPTVQDKILSICSRNLAPHGVAYISYNTLPGWHQRAGVREMMGYHVQRFTDPKTRVEQARAFLDFLVAATPNRDGTYHRLLKEEADLLRPAADSYLFHEHLEDANSPVYFWQFMERADATGLQYLGESWYHTRLDDIADDARGTLQDLSENLLQLEQYLDFLHNRTFRRTLLCHKDVPLNRTPPAHILMDYHLTALARPTTPRSQVDSSAVEKFTLDDGSTWSTNVALIKAALMALYDAWPRPLPFRALWSEVQSRLPSLAAQGARGLEYGPPALADAMLRCYLSNLVALHLQPPSFVLEVSARPVASPLARIQAATSSRVTNRRHRLVELGDLDRELVRYLDGSRDRAALVEVLVDLAANKVLSVGRGGTMLEDKEEMRGVFSEALEPSLRRLAKNALLVA
jgi:methyltransferase-like protein/ubiquinone/menaquinone biosynthesis C-methylase UbiE